MDDSPTLGMWSHYDVISQCAEMIDPFQQRFPLLRNRSPLHLIPDLSTKICAPPLCRTRILTSDVLVFNQRLVPLQPAIFKRKCFYSVTGTDTAFTHSLRLFHWYFFVSCDLRTRIAFLFSSSTWRIGRYVVSPLFYVDHVWSSVHIHTRTASLHPQ